MSDLAGRYRLLRVLGEGGMGVVHEAEDLRLERRVAIKMIRTPGVGEAQREQFTREARAAAAVSHPNACQLYEIGDVDGQPFLVMELLTGRSLAARLVDGPIPPDEAVDILLAVLRALSALHACGLIHRDLKPSNIFLTANGVKILDFGLVCRNSADAADDLTRVAAPDERLLVGTPHYMAPEQVGGGDIDARTDLFAAAVVLYEMLHGRRPFVGATALSVWQAIVTAEPRFDGFLALTPVLRRALQKLPEARYPNADAMAAELSAARGVAAQPAPPGIRLVVLPFRLLRDDAEMAFLERALPEAITTSLSSLRTILVRSNQAAGRAGAQTDPVRAGVELDVNHVLTGTILRAGERLRVTCQLIEVPGGRIAWSGAKDVAVGDLFQLQDDISRHIVESLPIGELLLERKIGDAPATPLAYELYLRANQLATAIVTWTEARALYQRCVVEDPGFAPGWAMLGRLERLTGKYLDADVRGHYDAAACAFARAFQLSPTLSLTHYQYAYLEVEQGHSDRATIRLATQLRERPHQADLFAALCHVARYCGMLDVSLAAAARARQLDARVRSSVVNTHLLAGDHVSMLAASEGVADTLLGIARFEVGAMAEALEIVRHEMVKFPEGTSAYRFAKALMSAFTGDADASRRDALDLFEYARRFPDGEFHFYVARLLARSGNHEEAVAALGDAIDRGFFPAAAWRQDSWLAPLRGSAGFASVCDRAWEQQRMAVDTFDAVGGYGLLGLKRPS